MAGKSIKFKVIITGSARALIPDYVPDKEIEQYITLYTPIYAGNKMWDDIVKVSDIEPDD